MGNIKGINIKNRTYYFFDDLINIKKFDSNLPKIEKKSHTKTLVFIILDIKTKDSILKKLTG